MPRRLRDRETAHVEGPSRVTPSVTEIENWIVNRVSTLTAVPAAEVDVRAPLTRHGLDSVALIALAADIEKWLGYRFRENPVTAHPTIAELAQFLATQIAQHDRAG
jgi:acyl carrier protein